MMEKHGINLEKYKLPPVRPEHQEQQYLEYPDQQQPQLEYHQGSGNNDITIIGHTPFWHYDKSFDK